MHMHLASLLRKVFVSLMEKLLVLSHLILLSSIQCLSRWNVYAQPNLCEQTPNPQLCNSLIKSNVLSSSHETNSLKVRDMALKVTLDHAQNVLGLISSMDLSSFKELAKTAWEDCLELYKDTVDQLNQTVFSSHNSMTIDDIQTYLSVASTNQETCKNGFIDFNISMNNSKLSMHNFGSFSMLLANSLALNRAFSTITNSFINPHTWKHRGDGIGSGGGSRRLLANKIPSWMIPKADHKLLHSSKLKVDLVVAKDGSGNFKTISEAIISTKHLRRGTKRFIIHVKKGIYKENVEIKKNMKNLMFIGDGIDATIVTSNKNVQDGSTTFRSATFAISGDHFMAKDITFENTAGPQKHQAVALRSGSDFSIFYRCSFKGYQDTLYVHSKRQFYKECDIYGTVDFIFGNAAVVIQNCNIYVRKPMNKQKNTITAQGRSSPDENTGTVIHNSIIEASLDLKPVQGSIKTFLGRPWKMYSRTVIMKSYINGLVDPTGWVPWNGNFALQTLYYAEYMNSGIGSDIHHRVRWAGYHAITNPIEASKFAITNFLGGDKWIPSTGVPYTTGL